MATAAHNILGYTGTLGRTSARRRGEPKYSKQRQARMIRAILSRRMMSPPSYEDVLDYVDTEVTYAENKREVLAVFGERTRKARVSDKEMREMYCTSLHNECASNGLDTCQTACDECKNPAACKKAERIEKEIKKHGRELSALERTMIYTAKEEKRAVKKAKFSVGQTVKCREGYELQCGFSGSQKVTQVKRYPDYVMYGIKGKAQGFVEEDWIVGVKGKPKKVTSKPKEDIFQRKRRWGMEAVARMLPQKLKRISELENVPDEWARRDRAILQGEIEEHYKEFPELKKIVTERKPIKPKKPVLKEKKKSKVAAEPKIVELGRDIPRWVKIKNRKYFFSRSFPAKKEADIWAGSIRKDKRLAHVKKYKPFIFYLSSSKTPQRYIVWATSPYEVEKPPKLRPAKVTPKKVKKAKPPKPTPTKTAPKKKKKVKTASHVRAYKNGLPKKPKPSKTTLHPKTLTDAQIKHARKHGYVNVTIDGVRKRVTKRNYAPRKRTVQWYRRGGKVCLKVRG